MAGGQSERQIQRAIRAMIATCFPNTMTHHSPNGAVLAGNAGQRAKQMGCLRGDGMQLGFPDLIVFAPGKVAFIEVKSDKGKLSDAQKVMHERLSGMGFAVTCARSIDEAYVFLRETGGFPWNGIDPRPNANDMWSVG